MDIRTLERIGECQNHILLIDSSTRDKTKWPKPSDYRVNLDNPLENVVGVDVVDSKIPDATYNVDSHNNRIGFGIRVSGDEDPSTAERRIEEFADSRRFVTILREHEPAKLSIKVQSGGLSDIVPAIGSNRFVTVSRSFNARTPTSGEAGALAIAPGESLPISEGVSLRRDPGGTYSWCFVESTGAPLSQWKRAKVIGSTHDMIEVTVQGSLYTTNVARVEDVLDTPLSDAVSIISSHLGITVKGKSAFEVDEAFYTALTGHAHEFEIHNFEIETGNLDIFHLAAAITYAMPTYYPPTAKSYAPCLVIEGTSPTTPSNYQPRGKFAFRSRDYFWFDTARTTAFSVLGFGEPASNDKRSMYTKLTFSNEIFAAKPEISGVSRHVVYTPGLINLEGVPYVRLRCPEVEQHLRAVNHGSVMPGLAILPLKSARIDYNIYHTRLPHPIAKLTHMTFHFERPDGEEYDFKGVDHSFLLSVRTVNPTSRTSENVTSCHPLFA